MKGWQIKKLNEICDNLDKQRIPITKSVRQPGNIPYYGASGIVDYVADYIFDEDLLLVSEDGANLLARTYPIAFSITGKTWVNNHAHVLRFAYKPTQKFVEYYLNFISIEAYVSGMAQPKLNQKALNSIDIPLPALPQQKRIVAILDEAFEGIDAAIANTQKNLANARELFESYLNGIFTRKGEGWVEKKFHEILTCQPRNGWSPPANNHSPTGTPVLTLSSVTGFHFNQYKRKFTNAPTKKDAYYWLKNGEFLISRSNTPELVGHVAICENLITPTICCDLIMKMQIDLSQANNKFIYWYFRTGKMRNLITSSAQGANPTMKKINKGIVQNLPVTFPSIQQQKNIADTLDDFYLNTQQLESLYQRKLEALQELKQSLLQKAFTGELTNDTAKEVADASKEAAA
ncbi:MAG: restriction endonuclease subunit S [Arthrospira sp. SH-MAG29]|nr:restriction endonuclease subunit S [Arthrospira sp. SH-MAG29]MBS0017365.1 restriction endonuclease subunit S [Arthrospira sp. SH-MAG29]